MKPPGVASVLASLALLAACAGGETPPAPATAPGAGDRPPSVENGEPVAEAAAWELPSPDLGYNAREGRAAFLRYCATCHGAEGKGDGFNAFNLDPRPRDLSDPAFQQEKTDADLLDVIRIGGGASGLSTAMPPWGRTLTPLQIGNLVAYIRTLPSPVNPEVP